MLSAERQRIAWLPPPLPTSLIARTNHHRTCARLTCRKCACRPTAAACWDAGSWTRLAGWPAPAPSAAAPAALRWHSLPRTAAAPPSARQRRWWSWKVCLCPGYAAVCCRGQPQAVLLVPLPWPPLLVQAPLPFMSVCRSMLMAQPDALLPCIRPITRVAACRCWNWCSQQPQPGGAAGADQQPAPCRCRRRRRGGPS